MIMLISKSGIDDIWPLIEHWLSDAMGEDKAYSTHDIFNLCKDGSLNLMTANRNRLLGFIIFRLYNTPQCKCCFVSYFGGEGLEDWISDAASALKLFLKEQGVRQISLIGRKGWGKIMGADSEQSAYLINL